MDKYLDFTLDPVLFSQPDMTAFLTNLHANNQKFVPIIDPGIYIRDTDYPTLVKGEAQNVFVKDLNGVDPYIGQVGLFAGTTTASTSVYYFFTPIYLSIFFFELTFLSFNLGMARSHVLPRLVCLQHYFLVDRRTCRI